MGIQLSPETEARLAAEASRRGVSVNSLLERLISERTPAIAPAKALPTLPTWHLGGTGGLHRRDIYDDAG